MIFGLLLKKFGRSIKTALCVSRGFLDKRCGVIAENLAVGFSKPSPKRPDDPIGEKDFYEIYESLSFFLFSDCEQ